MFGQRSKRRDPDRAGGLQRRRRERVGGASSRHRRYSPTVDCLEGRQLLSAITEFPLPTGNSPGALTVGPDGNLWFPDISKIGRITPSGAVTEFPLPTVNSPGALTVGPDGNLWFPEEGSIDYHGMITATGRIGRITPSGAITEFYIPSGRAPLDSLTVGPDGNLWFLEAILKGNTFRGLPMPSYSDFRIGRITPSGAVTEFPLPTVNSPGALTVGPDGNLWFPEISEIVRITPSGAVTEFPLPTVNSPGALTVGPDGNLWFGETGSWFRDRHDQIIVTPGPIGRITPSGTITEFSIPTGGTLAASLTVGPDGNLWFDNRGNNNIGGQYASESPGPIGRITPSGVVTLFPLPTEGIRSVLTLGPDGNLWFPENETRPGTMAIGRINVSALRGTGVVAVKHSGTRITAIVLDFDEAFEPRTARKRSSYSLAVGVLKRHSTLAWKWVKIQGVSYHRTRNTVRLNLARPQKGPLEVKFHVGSKAAGGVTSLGDFIAVVQ